MKIQSDDPRLTAYALGELDDEERAEFEKLLEQDEEARNEIDGIRATAAMLAGELEKEPVSTLTDEQRQQVEAAAAGKGVAVPFEARARKKRASWRRLAIAAVFLLVAGAGLYGLLTPNLYRSRLQSIPAEHAQIARVVERSELRSGETISPLLEELPEASSAQVMDSRPADQSVSQDELITKRPTAVLDINGNLQNVEVDGDLRIRSNFKVSAPTSLAMPPTQSAPAMPPTQSAPEVGDREVYQAYIAQPDAAASIASAKPRAEGSELRSGETISPALEELPEVSGAQVMDSRPADQSVSQDELIATRPTVVAKKDGGLQNVEVGGAIQIQGNYQTSVPGEDKTVLDEAHAKADINGNRANGEQVYLIPPTSAPGGGLGDREVYQAYIALPDAAASIASAKPRTEAELAWPQAEKLKALGYLDARLVEERIQHDRVRRGGGGYGGFGGGYGGGGRYGEAARNASRLFTEIPRTSPPGTESYAAVSENQFRQVVDEPLSTFSIDVDTASYANVRRFLSQGSFPPRDAVRIEELINYFTYNYLEPEGDTPFSVNVEVCPCPWNDARRLARIGLKGKTVPMDERPACNLVFLIDVSGSMRPDNKLPLLKKAMKLLARRLDEGDRLGMVTYSREARVALRSTECSNQGTILDALDVLSAGGATNGGSGIKLAYDMASEHYIKGGVNRVILATDGDFNVGITDKNDLVQLIERKAKSGVFLSVLGFGMGNLKDANLEGLADKGNGNYAYIDTFNEARKVMVDEIAGALITIAKDVKIQIEFNPAKVGAYRLIGYENRVLAARDFNDDRKDAGEIGAGHTVTALYELARPGEEIHAPGVDPLKYQKTQLPPEPPEVVGSDELMTVKLRYKLPESDTSTRIEVPILEPDEMALSKDFKFAAGVAAFGMLLRDSDYKGDATFDMALKLGRQGRGLDPDGHRAEFINLVKTAQALAQ